MTLVERIVEVINMIGHDIKEIRDLAQGLTVDGGAASSIYQPSEVVNGGDASGA